MDPVMELQLYGYSSTAYGVDSQLKLLMANKYCSLMLLQGHALQAVQAMASTYAKSGMLTPIATFPPLEDARLSDNELHPFLL